MSWSLLRLGSQIQGCICTLHHREDRQYKCRSTRCALSAGLCAGKTHPSAAGTHPSCTSMRLYSHPREASRWQAVQFLPLLNPPDAGCSPKLEQTHSKEPCISLHSPVCKWFFAQRCGTHWATSAFLGHHDLTSTIKPVPAGCVVTVPCCALALRPDREARRATSGIRIVAHHFALIGDPDPIFPFALTGGARRGVIVAVLSSCVRLEHPNPHTQRRKSTTPRESG